MRVTVVLLALFSAVASGAPVVSDEQPELQRIPLTPQLKLALIKDLENDMLRIAALKAAAQTVQLEEAAEETLLEAADEALNEEPSPERTQHIKEVETLLKRDKRAVQLLQGLLGGSSGGGGGAGVEASASGGSDSGSILNLVTPLLGSSSGGGGGGGGAEGGEGSEGASASAGSDSGSILGLVGPLLGSSSGGSGGSGGAEGSASGGSDSGSILNLVVPLLGSSSGSSGGSGGGGGGSDLSSILSLSSSSKQGGGTGEIVVTGDGNGNSLKSSLKGGKFALVQDKLQLALRAPTPQPHMRYLENNEQPPSPSPSVEPQEYYAPTPTAPAVWSYAEAAAWDNSRFAEYPFVEPPVGLRH